MEQRHLYESIPIKILFGCVYLADTFVVKETHSLTNVSGVVPVMSSHWAGVVPPERIEV